LPILCVFGGCAGGGGHPHRDYTSVEIQCIQTREFDTSYKIAFAAVVDVFQDLGFVIQTSDFNTGLVIAKSNVTSKSRGLPFLFYAETATRSKSTWQIGTAHVEELEPGKVVVRISFVDVSREVHNSGSFEENSDTVIDGSFYINFFAKIDKAIFVRQSIR
jgi:hypothetical protein